MSEKNENDVEDIEQLNNSNPILEANENDTNNDMKQVTISSLNKKGTNTLVGSSPILNQTNC